MLELGVHHLPLVDEDGAVVGMVTDLDLMALRRRQSFRLRSEIDQAADVASLAATAARIPETLLPLIRAGVDADHLDAMMATLFDGVTGRLVEIAQRELGPPPVAFAWIALGSSGRREQGLRSTQDHALVYGGDSDLHDRWFEQLAERVTDGLTHAGFAPSPTGTLATRPAWRGPETWWREQIGYWTSASGTTEASTVVTAFDGRVISGHLSVASLFRDAIARAAGSAPFLKLLRNSIIEREIPLGFLGDKVTSGGGDSQQLDVDSAGIRPIADMARLFSLSAGVRSVGTVRRLREAAAAGAVDPEIAEGLEEALAMLRELRTRHQARQWEHRRQADTVIGADELGPLERRALRDAFRLVRDVQRSLGGAAT
jgi:CBS domain-containing protein